MQVINDTEVFEPSECLFAIMKDRDDPASYIVLITDSQTWDNEQCLNDSFGSHSLPDGVLPEEMEEAMEATWLTFKPIEMRAALISAGFIESSELADAMSDR
jgi:hypothetical protein